MVEIIFSSNQAGNTLVNKIKYGKANEPVPEDNSRRQGEEKSVDFFSNSHHGASQDNGQADGGNKNLSSDQAGNKLVNKRKDGDDDELFPGENGQLVTEITDRAMRTQTGGSLINEKTP